MLLLEKTPSSFSRCVVNQDPRLSIFSNPDFAQLLDPAVNSISYLLVLDTLQDYQGFPAEERAQALINFFLSFDARQIRYVGSLFSQWLKIVASERFPLPVSHPSQFCMFQSGADRD